MKPGTTVSIRGYSLKSANDCPGRDPYSWMLMVKKIQNAAPDATTSGKDEGWCQLHEINGEIFDQRHQTKLYTLDYFEGNQFSAIRLEILTNYSKATKKHHNDGTQLNEFTIFTDSIIKQQKVKNSNSKNVEFCGDNEKVFNDFSKLKIDQVNISVSGWTTGGTGGEHFENLF